MKKNLLVCRSGGEFTSSQATLSVERVVIENFDRNCEISTIEFARKSSCQFYPFVEAKLIKLGRAEGRRNG